MFFNGPIKNYWEVTENIFSDKNRVYSARSLLQSCTGPDDIEATKVEMQKAGYRFSVTKDGETMYSDLTDDDIEKAKSIAGDVYDTSNDYTIVKDKAAVIRKDFSDNDHTYSAFAVKVSDKHVSTENPYIKRYIGLFVGLLIFLVVMIILVANVILSWWVSRSILKPLRQLSEGSDKIRRGELDFDMSYPKNDEFGMVINDFDEMRKHLKESVDARLKYERYRRELMIGISHDLRTPLTSIKGYLAGLRDGIADTPEMRMKYYDAIDVSADNLERLVSDLTDLSRTEELSGGLTRRTTELNGFYGEHIDELKSKYIKDDIDFELRGSDGEIFADINAGEIKRMDSNIVDNTIKYKKGGRSKVVFSLGKDGSDEVISITDAGPGVSDGDLERIFERFYRGDAARSEPGKGSGVGLAVVKRIVDDHEGTIKAYNGKPWADGDGGFTLEIRLPLKEGKGEDEKYIDS